MYVQLSFKFCLYFHGNELHFIRQNRSSFNSFPHVFMTSIGVLKAALARRWFQFPRLVTRNRLNEILNRRENDLPN